jgi:VIT1/CCC1 family predicted Fe2+/Mn2+ transporter
MYKIHTANNGLSAWWLTGGNHALRFLYISSEAYIRNMLSKTLLKATLTVFIFFIGFALISVGFVTINKVWAAINIGLGTCLILAAIVIAVRGFRSRMRE